MKDLYNALVLKVDGMMVAGGGIGKADGLAETDTQNHSHMMGVSSQ